MDQLRRDLRYAARTLSRSRAFTALVVLTMALGIGANTAVFSVVSAVLLRPLPYERPEELVRIYETFPLPGRMAQGSVSVPNFRDWREQNRSFTTLAAYSARAVNLQSELAPERLTAVAATTDLFPMLGVPPLIGRALADGEDRAGAAPVAVLSEGLWRQRFAADPDVLGRTLTLDGEVHTVVGVMPAAFRFPSGAARVDLWVPLRFTANEEESRGSHWFSVVGRLRPGTPLEAAQADMRGIAQRIAEQYPDEQAERSVDVLPLRETVVGRVRPTLLVLLGAAGLVLLIACANAANLLLARSASRQREVAIRTALGAGRATVVRQFLTEALLLAAAGAVLGIALAWVGTRALLVLAGNALPRSAEIQFDGGVLLFVLVVTAVTAVAFGLVPALQSSGTRLHDELKEGSGKASTGRGGQRFRSTLVVAQISLSLVLLIGAGLLMRTFAALLGTDTGMTTQRVLTMNLSVSSAKYPERSAVGRLYRPVLEQVRALPGVRSAAYINLIPLQNWGWNGNFGIEGRPEPESVANAPFAEYRSVSPGYFATLGIPMLRGRDFTDQDTGDVPAVVIVNRALAERYFPGEDPVGRRLLLGDTSTIVAVVGNIRQATLDREPMPELYLPYTRTAPTFMGLVVRTQVPPLSLVPQIQQVVRAVDPDQPVYDVQTMEEVVARSVSDRRLYLWLLGIFAGVALLLAMGGIYGVISYSVTTRTREIGIRVALGAEAARVLRLILVQGARIALAGLVLGLLGAFALTRLLAGVLYGVSATDPMTFAAVTVLLGGISILASYLPARRATRVDPMVALRAE